MHNVRKDIFEFVFEIWLKREDRFVLFLREEKARKFI